MFTDGYIFKDKNIEVNIDGYSITKRPENRFR